MNAISLNSIRIPACLTYIRYIGKYFHFFYDNIPAIRRGENTIKLKILIVDDSDIIRKVLKTFFEDHNIEVTTCSDGLNGIKNAVEGSPDLIFLDYYMPGMNGLDMLKVVRSFEQTKNIPIIFITSTDNAKEISDVRQAGATRVLFKPLKRNKITTAVEDIFGKKFLSELRIQKLFGQPEKENDDAAISKRAEIEIRNSMVKLFLKTADLRKSDITSYLEADNYLQLKYVVHELRGIGGMIGYPRLTLISEHLENMLARPADQIRKRDVHDFCSKIISLIEQVQQDNDA